MNSLVLLATANVDQTHGRQNVGEFLWFDQKFQVGFVAPFQMRDNFSGIQLIAFGKLLDGLTGLKCTTAAAADMKLAEQGALRSRHDLEHLLHWRCWC